MKRFLAFTLVVCLWVHVYSIELNRELLDSLNYSLVSDKIEVRYSNLTSVAAGTFDGFTRARYIYLQDNFLESLPDGLFSDCVSLETLDLGNNRLSSLNTAVFGSGLQNLTNLLLWSNRLTEFNSSGLFDLLPRLEILDLSNNQLESVEFSGAAFNLENLWLTNNKLSYLKPSTFANLNNLVDLKLGVNRLSELDSNIFSNLHRLEILELNENQLSQLDDQVFAGLSNLIFLKLGQNKLHTLSANVFAALRNLQLLELHSNQLTEDVSLQNFAVFRPLDAVLILNLGMNRIGSIKAEFFENGNLASVLNLNLAFNDLVEFDLAYVANLANLYELNLWSNRLESFKYESALDSEVSLILSTLNLGYNPKLRQEDYVLDKLQAFVPNLVEVNLKGIVV